MVEMYKSMYGSFEKLSSDNYDTWKPCISTILSAMLAIKIVTGEEVEDDLPIGNSPANIAKRESYKKRQALATTAILLSCTPEVRIHLSGITDAKAMWDTLTEQLSSSSSFGRREVSVPHLPYSSGGVPTNARQDAEVAGGYGYYRICI